MFRAKMNASGSSLAHVWSRDFGDGDDQFVKGLAVGPQAQVVVTGDFRSRINFGGPNHDAAGLFDIAIAGLKP
jgi:hypothetical protein